MKIKNISWTLGGLTTPIIVALISFPIIIQNAGIERFGVLSLAWGLIGYAGVFDLGIGRATTQLVSKYIGLGEQTNAWMTLKIATKVSLLVGFIGSSILFLLILLGGWKVINVSASLSSEVFYSSLIIAITIPVQCLSTMYRGYCEAYEKFKEVSVARIAIGVMNFAGPCAVSYFSTNVALMVSTILVSRITAVIVFHELSKSSGKFRIKKPDDYILRQENIKKELLKFGGWYTVSSTISPFLVQIDKFYIGAIVSATAVGIYSIPYEVVTKIIIFASAISTVAFPRYSALWIKDRKLAFKEFNKWLCILIIGMAIGCTILAYTLPLMLNLWIGEEISTESIMIGRVLCVGIFFNAIGVMYYTLIHATGDSKSTALIHLFELPIYLALLYILVNSYGVIGAALSWSFRMILDSFLMAIVASRKKS